VYRAWHLTLQESRLTTQANVPIGANVVYPTMGPVWNGSGYIGCVLSPPTVQSYGIIFSSPEHEVLMVSYCGQWLSVVRRPSCVNI